MKTKWIIGAVALQVLALAYLGGEREWVLRTGRTIYLRTIPVDPRDVMRGDYVRVAYEMSSVSRAQCRGRLADRNQAFSALPPDTRVYARLRVGEDEVAEFESLSAERPAEGVFLRGRTKRSWNQQLGVRYGLEALFVQQGQGRLLEPSWAPEDVQVPLEMKVALSPGGIGVLNGYRRSALGIGLRLEKEADAGSRSERRPRTIGATVELKNVSSNAVAIVDLPGGRSLDLMVDSWRGAEKWRWVHEAETPMTPAPDHVVVLKPGDSHLIKVDFQDAWWSVVKEEQGAASQARPMKLTELTREGLEFCLEYRSPERAACARLPRSELIWHGRLRTRTVNSWSIND